MSLTQYYTATALDGFIADPDNSLEWLFIRAQEPDGPLNYGDFIADVGALAMGSTTYEWILDHEFADKDPAEWKWPAGHPRAGSHAPAATCRPRRASSSRARRSRPCTRRWSLAAGGGTSGSSAEGTWRPVRRCRSRRGDRLHRAGDAGGGAPSAAAPDRAAPRRARTKRRLRMRQVLGRAGVRLTGPAGPNTLPMHGECVASHVLQALVYLWGAPRSVRVSCGGSRTVPRPTIRLARRRPVLSRCRRRLRAKPCRVRSSAGRSASSIRTSATPVPRWRAETYTCSTSSSTTMMKPATAPSTVATVVSPTRSAARAWNEPSVRASTSSCGTNPGGHLANRGTRSQRPHSHPPGSPCAASRRDGSRSSSDSCV